MQEDDTLRVLMRELRNLGDAMRMSAVQYNSAIDLIESDDGQNEREIIGRAFLGAQSMLTVGALVSKLLLPTGSPRPMGCTCALDPDERTALDVAKQRSRALRKALGIQGNLPDELNSRRVRNSIEHYDQRLHSWLSEDREGRFLDRVVGCPDQSVNGNPVSSAMRHIEPHAHTLSVLGESISLVALAEAVYNLANQADQWLMEHPVRLPPPD